MIAFLACPYTGYAQPYFFRHYQVENGLSNNTVFCSLQDKNGFLWFGTKDGLNRFDGYHFKQFNIRNKGNDMNSDMVACLLIDPEGRLLVGCQKGLYVFDKEKECLVRLIDSLVWINSMHLDNKGDLWFISATTLCRYNLKTKALKIFPTELYFDATSLCTDSNGDLWVSTSDGFLQHFNELTGKFTPFDVFSHSTFSVPNNWIQKIHPAGKNSLFVGTPNQGLKRFDITTSTYTDLLTHNPDNTAIYIRDIEQYSETQYWFATESGIFIFDTETGKFQNLKKKFLDPYSLSDNAVYALCKDREGGIWAGTYFGGINYYSKQYARFQKYFPDNTADAISGSAVREICEDRSGNLWIGTEDAGLNKFNPLTGNISQFRPTGKSNSIAYSNIHGLLVVGDELWIGTFDNGLDIMDTRTGQVIKHYNAGPGKYQFKNNFVVSLLQTKSGEVYVGTGQALFRYNKSVDGFDPVTDVPPNNFIGSLMEDHQNTIWVGTHGNGVFYYNPVTNEKGHFNNQPDNENSITNNTINAISEDSDHNIWISTEGGGLCKLGSDRKTFRVFTTKDGLPSNFIFKTIEDEKKHLWISTSRGLVDFNPVSHEMTVYTKNNGLLNNQFNYNSGYKNKKGTMYFGSVEGMISFRPDDFLQTVHTPPVYITGFQVKNKELLINKDSSFLKKSIIYTENITLPHDHSSFSIDFAALSFISPEMTTYSYLMAGLDKDWTEIKPNRKIYFTNLAPGRYVFKLKAAINGNWSEKERQLTIHILPPFWATWWAYLLYALFTIALAYYLLRSYHIIVEDKKEKEIYEAKIDFFTNVAHEIRTPLTLIKGPVENLRERVDELPEIKEDVVTMERNTNRLIALITQILDFRQTETKGFSMDFVRVNVSELLREAYLNFSHLAKKKRLEYDIDLPDTDIYAYADEEALNKIFSNLFNNGVKYAHQKIYIRLLPLQENARNLMVEFASDGMLIPAEKKEKIFEPFYRIKNGLKQQGTGIGLALARSLAELHNGRLYLKDDEQTGFNIFVFCLPLSHNEKDNTNGKKNTRLLKLK